MNLFQALGYFLREATRNLLRSWKISLLAVTTIAVSLFVGGVFLVVANNLSRVVERWRGEAKIVVYLESGVGIDEVPGLLEHAASGPWVGQVTPVTAGEAGERFAESFPSLEGLLHGWSEEPLPASVEIGFDPLHGDRDGFDAWLDEMRDHERVATVDDDRTWLRQLETVLQIVTAVGVAIGGVLLAAAVFTIASVIRFTAHLYREEIEVMRLVGATEFFIRGPFFVEGLLQGLAGGVLALLGLYGGYLATVAEVDLAGSAITGLVISEFLPPRQQGLILLVGTAAGCLGAVLSLRREI